MYIFYSGTIHITTLGAVCTLESARAAELLLLLLLLTAEEAVLEPFQEPGYLGTGLVFVSFFVNTINLM